MIRHAIEDFKNNNPEYDVQLKIYALIDSLNSTTRGTVVIRDIVLEEIPAYFSGRKTAEEVAEIIQNRVSRYLAEMN